MATIPSNLFSWLDYMVFAFMLLCSALIGVYFAFFAKQKQNTTSEYLMGGKTMGIFPISMSLIASYVSGISLLGIPAEVYVFGTQFWMTAGGQFLVCITMSFLYLPVFYATQITSSYISGIAMLGIPAEVYTFGTQYWMLTLGQFFVCMTMSILYLPVFFSLQITSSYESNPTDRKQWTCSKITETVNTKDKGYLKLRFNQPVRLLGSIFFIIKMLLYIPVVIYVPALAFNQVTGINIHLITPIVCCVCIFYTTLGGLKAVVWTDTLQTIMMFGGVIIVMVLGTAKVGGIGVVLDRASDADRLEFFNMDPDPRIRHTFWTVVVGGYFNWLAGCTVNQAMVQRCLAMPTLRKSNITVAILGFGILLIISMCCVTGLIIFAYFYDCDPVTTKTIGKSDQLLPYFVMETSQAVPGLPGLFVAGVFSAALSSMSTGLNSMTGVIFEDLIRPSLKKPMSEQRASTIMKLLAGLLGLVCVALVFVVEKLGALIQAVQSLTSIVSGPLLGMFTLGMCFPWANSKGALVGGIVSFVSTASLSFIAQTHIAAGFITFPKKPVTIDGCDADIFNRTVIRAFVPTADDVPAIFRVSYMWYTFIGACTAILVGMLVSCLTGLRDPSSVDRKLLTPLIHRFLPTPKDPAEETVKLDIKR